MTWVLRGWRSLGLTTAVVALFLVAGAQPAAAAPCDAPITNPVACENTKPGNPASEWDVSGAGDASIQGFATDISVDQGQTDLVQGRHRRLGLPHRHLPDGLLRRARARARSRRSSPLAALPQIQPACLQQRRDRAGRLRQLGRVGHLDGPGRRGLGHLLRQAGARRHRRRQPHRVRRARRRARSRPAVPDLGHHLAGLQPLRRQQPLHGGQCRPAAPTRSATTARSRRAATPTGGLPCSTPSTRWSAGWSANGYDVSYIDRRRHRPPAASELLEHKVVPVGRPRRVLVAGPAGQRRGGARSRRPPRVLQRQRGLLEDPLGVEHRLVRDAAPHARRPTRRPTPTPRSTRSRRSGRAPGATRGSARRPTAGARRMRSRAQLFRVNDGATGAIRVPAEDGKMRFWRNTTVASPGGRGDRRPAHRHARLRVGRGRRTTASAPPARSGSPRPRSPTRRS